MRFITFLSRSLSLAVPFGCPSLLSATTPSVETREAVKGTGEKPPVVKTHLRSMVVLPEFVDNIIGICNGKEFVEVQIKPEMISP